MPSSATRSGEPLPDRRHDDEAPGLQKCETPLEAGFRQSGSTYLPPGRTSCEAGVHQAGFCALVHEFRSLNGGWQGAGCCPQQSGPFIHKLLIFGIFL